MNWYIGQPIVCIKNHSQGVVKKGQEFHVKSLLSGRCKCKHALIDVGIRDAIQDGQTVHCYKCYGRIKESDIWWISEELFAPLDFDISELTDILKEPIKEYVEK